MKHVFVGLVLLVFSMPLTTQAQRTCTSYILNPTVSGGIYSFDIYSQNTNGSLVVRVGTSSFYFDVDQTGGFKWWRKCLTVKLKPVTFRRQCLMLRDLLPVYTSTDWKPERVH